MSHLRQRMAELEGRAGRPPHLWILVTVYVTAGVVLILLAAASATGGGPFS